MRRSGTVRSRVLLPLLLLAVLLPAALLAAPLTVTAIDVDQGDSILVQFPDGQDMLVDAGTSQGGQAVAQYLRAHQSKRIDLLVATHPHADHIGGMQDVLRAVSVTKAWESPYRSCGGWFPTERRHSLGC